MQRPLPDPNHISAMAALVYNQTGPGGVLWRAQEAVSIAITLHACAYLKIEDIEREANKAKT